MIWRSVKMEKHKKWETVSQEYVINSPFIKLRKDMGWNEYGYEVN